MAAVLEEFYENLRAVGVSAHTGAGIDDFLVAVDEAVDEYNTEYKPLLEKLKAEKLAKQEAQQEAEWKVGQSLALHHCNITTQRLHRSCV